VHVSLSICSSWIQEFYRRGYNSIANGNEFMCLFKIHFQKNVNIYSLNVDVLNLKRKFIYLGPSPSPLLSPDVLADVVDLKLSIAYLAVTMWTLRPRLHETEKKSNRDENRNFQYIHMRPVRKSQIFQFISLCPPFSFLTVFL
jgi:hypothetical protein